MKVTNNNYPEIRSVERGICPIAESIMTDSVIFQCACVRLPYFTSGVKSDDRNGQDGQPASLCQILWRSVKPLRDMAIFRYFKMATAAILDF